MKFVLSAYGSRGDVEPSVVVGRELLRRGHEVHVALPPNLVAFAEAVGLDAVAYGEDSQAMTVAQRDYWASFFDIPWNAKELDRLGREIGEIVARCWTPEATLTLAPLAHGADLVVAGYGFEQFAANVAEHHDIPLATLHFFPMRPNGHTLRFLPAPLGRFAMSAYERLSWAGPVRKVEDAQRRELGLAAATTPWGQRISDRGSLEIQAYEQILFPGLTAEWANSQTAESSRRPFVGALALESPTPADAEVTSWIAEGTPPVFFGFGSTPMQSPADTISMITAACEQLGQRALVGTGSEDFSAAPKSGRVKVVGTVNYATVFPACRAVVHHGGAGTVAACLRAGVPQLILWTLLDQPLAAAQLKHLKVGTGRRLVATTRSSLVEDLRRILAPQYSANARQISTRTSSASESAVAAAELIELFARRRHVC